MESSSKTWSYQLLFIVPVLCILVSVALCEHTQSREADDLETVKRELKAYFETENKKLQNKVEHLQQQLTEATEIVASVKREKRQTAGSSGGAVYVHWGRQNCSSTTERVYTGIAGGGLSAHAGAAVNMLCMTHSPVWGKYGNNGGSYAYIYGAEYELPSTDFPFGHERAPALNNHDVPCSVCRSDTRTSVIMIPGTIVCEAGWQKEYSGYLMYGSYGQAAATEYNCIDANPEIHESGFANENGYLLFRVKAKCGSLPCPPYVEMREITCVICTK